MNWEDEGFLLSKRKFKENTIIVNTFTKDKGRASGLVYGGTSRKVRNYLQIGNKIFFSYNLKNSSNIGYFKTELIKPVLPLIFDDKYKTAALVSTLEILNIILPEGQSNQKVYLNLDKLINNLEDKNWFYRFINWELFLIKALGFEFIIQNSKDIKNFNLTTKYKIDGDEYDIPNFLIAKKFGQSLNNEQIFRSLLFTKEIFMNKFFIPNNIRLPKSRFILEKYFC